MWTPDPSKISTAAQRDAEATAAARLAEFPNLEPDQFWHAVRLAGLEPDIKTWLDGLAATDHMLYAQVSAKLEFAKHFERDHWMIVEAIEALNMNPAELDTLWKYVAS